MHFPQNPLATSPIYICVPASSTPSPSPSPTQQQCRGKEPSTRSSAVAPAKTGKEGRSSTTAPRGLPAPTAVATPLRLGLFAGLEFVAGYFRGPSRDMRLSYLEYRITPEESTLINQFPRDHPVFTDPDAVKSKGWNSLKEAYLDKQDVRLNMKRFRPVLKKAIGRLRANKLNR